jgi:hypothetical protein
VASIKVARPRESASEFTLNDEELNATMSEREEKKFTLEEAFSYDGSSEEGYVDDVRKGILAVSYLLDSISKIGSDDVDARIAQGLAHALRHYAKEADFLLTSKSLLHEAEDRLREAERTMQD